MLSIRSFHKASTVCTLFLSYFHIYIYQQSKDKNDSMSELFSRWNNLLSVNQGLRGECRSAELSIYDGIEARKSISVKRADNYNPNKRPPNPQSPHSTHSTTHV